MSLEDMRRELRERFEKFEDDITYIGEVPGGQLLLKITGLEEVGLVVSEEEKYKKALWLGSPQQAEELVEKILKVLHPY